MRWAIGIVVVVVFAVAGYGYFGSESGRPIAERVVQPVAPATETTGRAAPHVADQTSAADRTKAVADEAARMAQQAAADAAQRMQATADQVAKAAQDVANSGAKLEVGDTDIGKDVGAAVNDITAALGGISDEASAQAAVPRLVAIDARLVELKPKIEQLSDDARQTFASLVTGMLPKVQSAVDRLQATPGGGDVVKPALDPIMTKLEDWSKKPA
jgi:hypothetical protein